MKKRYTTIKILVIVGIAFTAYSQPWNAVSSYESSLYESSEEVQLPVSTQEAMEISDTTAVLRGELLDIGDYDEADVFFKIREAGLEDNYEETWWVAADAHIGHSPEAIVRLENAVADVNELGISDKAILLGDNVHESFDYVELYENAMNKLNHEWIDVLGNHDFDRGATGLPLSGRTVFSKYIGGVRFIALSDEGMWADGDAVSGYQTEKNLSKEQNDWFKAQLDKNPDMPTVLWSHQGLSRAYFSPSPDDGPCFWDENRRGWLKENIDKYNIKMWYHGHHHRLRINEVFQDPYGLLDFGVGALRNGDGGTFMTVKAEDGLATISIRFRDHEKQQWLSVLTFDGYVEEYVMEIEIEPGSSTPWSETEKQIVSEPGQFNMKVDSLKPETTYEFIAVIKKGDLEWIGETRTFTTDVKPTGVEEKEDIEEIVEDFRIIGNYPNPFNPSTRIVYELATDAEVSFEIFNAQGQIIQSKKLGRQFKGRHLTTFDAGGLSISSGVYHIRLHAGSDVYMHSMTYIK